MEPTDAAEPPPWHTDPDTLRSVVDDPGALATRIDSLRAELQEPEDVTAELLALGDLVEALRIAGGRDEALELAERAVTRSEVAGTGAQQHLARLRRIPARTAIGLESDAEAAALVAAAGEYGPVIAALTHQTVGHYAFDRDEFDTAAGHFRIAAQLRDGLDLPEAAESRLALDTATRHAAPERGAP